MYINAVLYVIFSLLVLSKSNVKRYTVALKLFNSLMFNKYKFIYSETKYFIKIFYYNQNKEQLYFMLDIFKVK